MRLCVHSRKAIDAYPRRVPPNPYYLKLRPQVTASRAQCVSAPPYIGAIMGRLSGRGLPSRVAGASLRRIAGTAPSHDDLRASSDHRKLYKDPRWAVLRREVLDRAGWQCERTGVLLVGKRHAPNSAVVDHIRPHRGDPDLFFDLRNLQAVSKAWHDRVKQKMERAEGR